MMESSLIPTLLETKDLTIKFGGLTAIDKVNIEIKANELVAIIGPNGAGKTTLFNAITGIYAPTTGLVNFKNTKLNKTKPSEITRLGIARTFQNIRLFNELTALENIKIARHTRIKYNFFEGILRTKRFTQEEALINKEALEILELVGLRKKANELAKNLPYGEQRKLEIARALFTKPDLLLLDEPAAGMNPTETKELSELINFLNATFNVAIILIEHDMNLVMKIAKKIFVLNYGQLIKSGTPSEIQNDPDVIRAYLGPSVAE